MAAAVERGTGIVEIDALEFGREPVRIAFAPYLAIGDDVEARALLIEDREPCCIILRFRELLLVHTPEFAGAHARRKALGELRAVDQPFGLGIGSDQARGQHR